MFGVSAAEMSAPMSQRRTEYTVPSTLYQLVPGFAHQLDMQLGEEVIARIIHFILTQPSAERCRPGKWQADPGIRGLQDVIEELLLRVAPARLVRDIRRVAGPAP